MASIFRVGCPGGPAPGAAEILPVGHMTPEPSPDPLAARYYAIELQACADSTHPEANFLLQRMPKTGGGRKTRRLHGHLALQDIRLSDQLRCELRKWSRDVDTFFFPAESPMMPRCSTGNVGDLTSMYWRMVGRDMRNEIETIRHRFDCLALYHVAVHARYHTDRSWRTNGLVHFAALTRMALRRDHPQDAVAKNLDHWVKSGMAYRELITCLSEATSDERCGYLIILPKVGDSEESPYNSPVFLSVQYGDFNTTKSLFIDGHASIRDVDPYQLGLLYYAGYYCWKNYGPERAVELCEELIMLGADVNQRDDMGNDALETLLDCALVHSAMTPHPVLKFGTLCDRIGRLCGRSLSRLGIGYLGSRGFTPLHQVLLRIDTNHELKDYLQLSSQNGTLHIYINCPDSHHRTPLRWAIEFGWVTATELLLDYGVDPRQTVMCERGHTTLLHLAVAGSPYQLSQCGFRAVVKALLQAGVDVNARDHKGWTPLHTAISWGHYDLHELLGCPNID
ncbi:hypothetical protein FE257_005949 [Aspergillus nanangensis]|uniref:Ankyrin repeat protein n=1 Tax=Aspergillus nanangensis TaxID=2582783 RepID=A0AAD4CA23_ASPNN|nr:hypothetical protein FE257_005949 [Aspergillus nanangensis]